MTIFAPRSLRFSMIQSEIESFIGDQSAELDALDQGIDSHGVEAMARQQVQSARDCPRHR